MATKDKEDNKSAFPSREAWELSGGGTKIQTLQKPINSTPEEFSSRRTKIPGQRLDTSRIFGIDVLKMMVA